jgi:ATP-dependent Lon protease
MTDNETLHQRIDKLAIQVINLSKEIHSAHDDQREPLETLKYNNSCFTKIVFHSVPLSKKDEDDVRQYAEVEKVALQLLGIPQDQIFNTLEQEFPWLLESVRFLRQSCEMCRRGNGILRLPPLLMLGPAGIGKTSLLRRFCELGDIPYIIISAGGTGDSMILKGTNRAWSSSQPGAPVRLIRQTMVANPLIIIDEIDKAGTGSQNGNFTDSLIQLLERSSAEMWQDEYLLGRADLSGVNYVLTANRVEQLSGPLLSRVRSIQHDTMKPSDILKALPQAIENTAALYGWSHIPDMSPKVAQAIARKSRDLRKMYLAVQAWLIIAAGQEEPVATQHLH